MLFDPTRHETLQPLAWDEGACRAAIQAIVDDTERHFSPERYWPPHPRDIEPGDDLSVPGTSLYYGACGVIWALQHLQALGAARLSRDPADALDTLLERSHDWLASADNDEAASYMMGDTPILLLAQGRAPTAQRADQIAALIEGNLDHPSRELMWGAPGTMLAASFLHERDGGSALGRAVPALGAAAVGAARMVGAPRLRVLDAGPLRPPQHLPRRRARLRGHRQRADPRPPPARRRIVGGVAGLHRQHRAAHRDARRPAGELARRARRARGHDAAHAHAVLPRRAGFRRLPGRACPTPRSTSC